MYAQDNVDITLIVRPGIILLYVPVQLDMSVIHLCLVAEWIHVNNFTLIVGLFNIIEILIDTFDCEW